MKVSVQTGDPRSLTLLEVNARYMRHEQFQQLVSNIRRDGVLTSTPFVWEHDGVLEVLSGNHRVAAAIEAGLEEVTWLQTADEMTRDEAVAIQLSHNAIAGEDDPAILAQLYESIEDMDMRAYAGLDDRDLELLSQVQVGNLSEASLDFQSLSLTFLPADGDAARKGFEEAEELSKGADHRWIARYEDHFRLLEDISTASKATGIKNMGAALSYVLDVFEANRTDLQEGFYDAEADTLLHNGWIPMSVLFGTDDVPAAAAVTIRRAIEKMTSAGDVAAKHRWQALEAWAADYLAGA